MKKIGLILLISGYWFLVTGFFSNSHAQDETLTLLTYYPAPYGVYQQLEVLRQDGSYSNLMISQYNNATIYPMITFRKARGTLASPTAILEDYRLGTIVFGGHDGTSFQNGAEIYAIADANWGASQRGTELRFQTRDDDGPLTDQMTIAANGNVSFTNMPGIASYNSFNVSVDSLGSTWETYDHMAINIPSSGYILVESFGDMLCFNSGSNMDVWVGITDSPTVSPSGGAVRRIFNAQPPSYNIRTPYAVGQMYTVDTAGSKTFYIRAKRDVVTGRIDIAGSIHAIYFPVEYNP